MKRLIGTNPMINNDATVIVSLLMLAVLAGFVFLVFRLLWRLGSKK